MIKELKKDLLNFLAESYNDYDWSIIEGDNNFNKLLDDEIKIQMFTLGNMQTIANSFLLVQAKNLNLDRAILPNIGVADFGRTITLNVYIEATTNGENAAILSDSYMESISKCLELFIYNYKTYPIVNPKIAINKYFLSDSKNSNSNLNSINNLIVSADLTFSTKTNELNLE